MNRSTTRLLSYEFMDRFLDAQQAMPRRGEPVVMPGVAVRQEAFAAYVQLKSAVMCRNVPDAVRYARRLRGDPEYGVLAAQHLKRVFFARAVSRARRHGGRIEVCPQCQTPNAVPLHESTTCAACDRDLQPALAGVC